MSSRISAYFIVFTFLSVIFLSCSGEREEKVLVFFHPTQEKPVPEGFDVLQQIGQKNGFAVDTTLSTSSLKEENLQNYSALVLLGTPAEALGIREQTDIERFVQAGGGLVSINASINTPYLWPWYQNLLNSEEGSEADHPEHQETPTKLISAKDNSAEQSKLQSFKRAYDGGHVFCLNNAATLSELQQALQEGIIYAIGDNRLDYNLSHSLRVPEDNRFVKKILVTNSLDEPTELEMLPDGRIIFTERKGAVKLYLPKEERVKVLAQIDVHTEFEDGLMGIAKDPDFYHNQYIYMYYSPAGEEPVQHLSRFKLLGDSLLLSSEKIVLKVPVQRETCCHTAGSIEFEPDGLLYLSTGDDTNPFASDGYAPIDERPGRSSWDAQGTSANTNDLRGKILRIKPEADGTYSIPDGNLFPKDGSQGRPEIYVMGCRNPYRINIDQETGYLYWGDVGPDARVPGDKGPKGHDAVKQAKKAGNFGWPYFRGNMPYHDYNFETNEVGPLFDPEAPVNTSVNNTGIDTLPPFQKSFIWYPYDETTQFPYVEKGGRNAMAGPVYHYEKYAHYPNRLPEYFDNKLFVYDWIRDWIRVATMDENGDLVRVEPFLDSMKLYHPIDMLMGHDGSLYVLEYGTNWFAANPEASLFKIDYAEGNRKPIAKIAADKTIGAAPLTVNFSSEGSMDYDENDALSYTWYFTSEENVASTEANPAFTFENPGIYKAKLVVTDEAGESVARDLEIQVGNERPEVNIEIAGNTSFYWDNRSINYQVKVIDKEDGTLNSGINSESVQFYYDFLPQGHDITTIAAGHQQNTSGGEGLSLIENSGCKACHSFEKASVGPAYNSVADRYENDEATANQLVQKVLTGGSGNWGDRAMPPQAVTEEDATTIVQYILSLDDKNVTKLLPLQAVITADRHIEAQEDGSYILTATYTDEGGEVVGPLTAKEVVSLRNARVQAEFYDESSKRANKIITPKEKDFTYLTELRNGDYFAFENVDFTDIAKLIFRLGATASGFTLEARLDAQDGPLISTLEVPNTGNAEVFRNIEADFSEVPSGKHTLYFVVRSAEGLPKQSFVTADWVNFHPNESRGVASR